MPPAVTFPTAPGWGNLARLVRLFARTQLTRGRLAAIGAFGVLVVAVAAAVAGADPIDADQAASNLVLAAGLSLLVPVAALVMASASFGDLREDATFVYLWLRPVSPVPVVAAAWATATGSVWVLVVVPLSISAAIVASDVSVVVGAVVSVTVAVVVYSAVFVLLGLVTTRPLAWGIGYVLLWEGFVALAGDTASRLALRAYTRSVLADLAGTDVRQSTISMPWAWLVPLVATGVALWVACRRFAHQDVA